MRTELSARYSAAPEAAAAAGIMQKCVHCGLCNATCPTYQLLGDELDGPRGRIYLIKQLLEGQDVSRTTQLHLDRCLTCRACETTCPSGVEFGQLIDIGRSLVDQRVRRPVLSRAWRWILKEGLTSVWFKPLLRAGQMLRPVLPHAVRTRIPLARADSNYAVPGAMTRRVLVLEGCVQPALSPNINRATSRVLAAAGIEAISIPAAGCCGAIRQHLGDRGGALQHMRHNIDVWWPTIAAGHIESIVINASGCSVCVKDYGHALKDDPAYAAKAAQVSALARDLSEMLAELAPRLKERLPHGAAQRVAFHAPCTLQHGQKISGQVEAQLAALGFTMLSVAGGELCCGSAGTYSLLQPQLAGRLRDAKLQALAAAAPDCIASANIGCILHLQAGTATPVRHWVELLDAALCGHPPQGA